jgi:carbamate kinase
VLVTGVDQVYVDFNKPTQRALDRVGIDEMRRHLADGQFPVGSMGPKVDSAISFVEAGGEHAVITSLPGLRDALAGNGGTHVIADPNHTDQKE